MSWLQVLGREDPELEAGLAASASERLKKIDFTQDDLEYIRKLNLIPKLKTSDLDPQIFTMLRRLCTLCDAKPLAQKITSHRPLIGPVIVAAKKILYSILSVLLKSREEQQRKFNTAALEVLIKLAENKKV